MYKISDLYTCRWFLNLGFKLFCSIGLLPNTDPTYRQRLWSYDHMAL